MSGSPPVRRILLTPSSTKATRYLLYLFQSQYVLFWHECHVLCHAVDAAKVAAIGDGKTDIIDPTLKAIDQYLEEAYS